MIVTKRENGNPSPQASAPAGGAAKRGLVLIVDDAEDSRAYFAAMLKPRYELRLAASGAEALQAAAQDPRPDLILLDILMPDLDGYEVCKRLKASEATADVPVIFVTSGADPADETRALKLGAADFLTKPVSAPVALLRVGIQLALRDRRRQLEDLVAARTRDLERTRLQLIRRLARAMEYREGGLTHRVARVDHYVRLLAAGCGLNRADCDRLADASPLYDIGKLGISEAVLRKTDALNEREWAEIRRHPEIGAEIIGEHADPLLATARVMALTHHERWDGTGYPAGMAGEAIPFAGRVMAVADAFEAMTTTQRHREPLTAETAAQTILRESGKQFDPAVVAAFRKVIRRMVEAKSAVSDELEGIHDLDFSATVAPGDTDPAATAVPRPPAKGS